MEEGSPEFHPSEADLLSYAAGTACEGVALVLATHLALCPRCRAQSDGLDALGGAVLAGASAPLLPDALQSVMARLDEPELLAEAPPVSDATLPRPLRDYVGPLADLKFRLFLPGIRQVQLPVSIGGIPVRLFRMDPGYRMPEHGHAGTEHALVLAGGYIDDRGDYGRGDMAVREAGEVHRVKADRQDGCLVLVAHSGRLLPTARWMGLITRLVNV